MYAKDGPTPKMASLKLLEQVRKGPLHDLYRSPGKKLKVLVSTLGKASFFPLINKSFIYLVVQGVNPPPPLSDPTTEKKTFVFMCVFLYLKSQNLEAINY